MRADGGQKRLASRRQPETKAGGRLAAVLRKELPGVRRGHLKPPPKLNLVEWADQYRFLSAEASSQPGKWSTERVEVARGPMLAASDPEVQEITVMCCTQLMKTELILNLIGFFVHQDPAPILVLQPTVHIAEAFSKDRVDPMFRDTPALMGNLGGKKSRDGSNTILHKQFAGGHLTMVGANAPGELAMRPVRVVLCDEVDKYPVSAGDEGDPIKLASERSATFWNRLIVKACSPTIEGKSRIALEYEASDKRVFEAQCPHCDQHHEMRWQQVHWPEGVPEEAAYTCPECGVVWSEPDRLRAISKGHWKATAPFKGHAGFKVSKLASPWESLSALAKKWEACKGKQELLKTFFNTQLAETYAETGEAPESQRLYDKREQYATNTLPEDVVFLTAGVDVQGDRLEMEVVGWCLGKRSYSIDYRVILGDTSTVDGSAWVELRRVILEEQWQHASGPMLPLRYTTIDSGFRTSIVYEFVRKIGLARCAPIKGRDEQALIISPPRSVDYRKNGKAIKGLKLYTVGSSVCKSELYGWLKLDKAEDGTAPPCYCHFPEYDLRYFRELTSEQMVLQVDRKGFLKTVWVKTPGVRNEPLDCRVYARAAAAIAGMDRWKDKDWDAQIEKRGRITVKPPVKPTTQTGPAGQPQQQPQAQQRRRSSYWDRER